MSFGLIIRVEFRKLLKKPLCSLLCSFFQLSSILFLHMLAACLITA